MGTRTAAGSIIKEAWDVQCHHAHLKVSCTCPAPVKLLQEHLELPHQRRAVAFICRVPWAQKVVGAVHFMGDSVCVSRQIALTEHQQQPAAEGSTSVSHDNQWSPASLPVQGSSQKMRSRLNLLSR